MASNSGAPISPVGVSKPELTLTAAAINDEPIELDSNELGSKPTSPENRRGSRADVLKDLSPEEREKKAKLMSERKGDRAVLVDIEQTPHADEFEQAGASETDVQTPIGKD